MSSKGQVVIPSAIRIAHSWEPGIEFDVEDTPEGLLLRPVPTLPASSIDDVMGCTGYSGPRRSLEAMRRAVPPGLDDGS